MNFIRNIVKYNDSLIKNHLGNFINVNHFLYKINNLYSDNMISLYNLPSIIFKNGTQEYYKKICFSQIRYIHKKTSFYDNLSINYVMNLIKKKYCTNSNVNIYMQNMYIEMCQNSNKKGNVINIFKNNHVTNNIWNTYSNNIKKKSVFYIRNKFSIYNRRVINLKKT